MSSDKKPSVATERRLVTYPPPKFHSLTEAFAIANEMPSSKAVAFIIKDFFDRMSEQERQRILQVASNRSSNHY